MDGDLELLERWRGGERSAGEELFRKHFGEIYAFFRHKLGDEAQDLAQRTFLTCLKARDQFRGDASFRTFLFTIARNELHGYLRQQRSDDPVDLDRCSIAEIVTSPSERLGRVQQKEHLLEALRRLPVEQQLLLELHYWHEQDAAQLGEIFGATPGAIRVRLLRARAALCELIEAIERG